ncbi:hypothetical protein GCM10027190_17120 [Spirosoma areae]
MTACIVGINAFQGYWLWTTYQLNQQQFTRTVQDALFHVLQQQQMAEARQLLDKKLPGATTRPQAASRVESNSHIIVRRYEAPGEASGVETRVFVNKRIDTLRAAKPPGRIVVTNNARQRPAVRPVLMADTFARRISSLLLLDWADGADVNLEKLRIAYGKELRRRAIDAPFRLDTLTIRPRRTQGNVVVFRSGWSTPTDTDGNVLRTTPEMLNPVKNRFAQASFATPTFYLLRRMSWLLGSSVLLLVLTTGCFLFMLATILRQKKLSEVKNDFINNMTHELKTPIATVTAAVEALQHFGALSDPQRTQTYLTISQTNLQRLADLVEKVLTLAVEEKKELALNPEWIKPSELIHQILSNYHLKFDKPVEFDVDVDPVDEPVWIDRFHMANALNNLIDNAIKYAQESVVIRVSSRKHEHVWRLSVKDNGIGIPKAYQSAIFDRFFRVPTGNLHPVKGFGLGLSYARQVIEKHGGLIDVVSEPGEGSEFILLIPEQGGEGQAGIKRFRLNLNPLYSAS